MEGLMAPVLELMLKPPGEELKEPPVKFPVPFNITCCADVSEVQNGVPLYEIEAVGNNSMTMVVEAVTAVQPPDAGVE